MLSLQNLNRIFQWEFRVAYLAFLGLPFFFADQEERAFNIWIACVVAVLVSDAIMSLALMAVFLRPILDALKMAKGVVRTDAFSKLHSTMWMTMGEQFRFCFQFFSSSVAGHVTHQHNPLFI